MRALVRHVASVAVAVALGGTPPVAFAAVEPPAEGEAPVEGGAPVEAEAPVEGEEPDPQLPDVAEEPPLDTDTEPPLDTDTDPPLLDTDTEPEPIDDVDETLDRDQNDEFEDDYQFLRDSPEAKTAKRWLVAGIASTVTGGVLVGGAIATGVTPPCNFEAGHNCFEDARNRAAVTMGVPGGLLLIGGVAMTVVGALQRRRLWNGQIAVAPAPNGLVISGRF